jgi:Holliday junction resolvase
MSNNAKAKGTAFETLILNYMRGKGFNRVYRPATKGVYDTGDINGIGRPGIMEAADTRKFRQAIVQCKNQKTFKLADWLNDTVSQAAQAEVGGDALPILAVKRPRNGEKSLGETYCIMRLDDLIGLMREAGYE